MSKDEETLHLFNCGRRPCFSEFCSVFFNLAESISAEKRKIEANKNFHLYLTKIKNTTKEDGGSSAILSGLDGQVVPIILKVES